MKRALIGMLALMFSWLSVASAIAAPEIGGYRLGGASTGQLWPWYGYLVRSFITADLIIPANPMEGLRSGGDSYPTLDEAAATGKDIPIPPPPPPLVAKTPE